ncbi:hypothetical protein [Candidatus Mesenet endosymbiont of Phosphuga atrata]|uniref:TomO hydrophobic C-terminal domain-containing protein n=1 Tax=Candidatus Mesenet endosymbiont of Phosphuga atrata TaxID=3066221 RepID=UPI0030D588A0
MGIHLSSWLLAKENSLLSNKKSQPSKEAEEVKRLKSELEEKKEQIKYLQKDVDNLAEENSKLVKAKRQLENARDNSIDSDNRITQENTQLQNELKDVQQQLTKCESENKELKNKEASIVNTQGIKGKVNYTSASFILFGVCAVGASLTIPYLAACITLAIAASTFLVAGLCYSYKVNTALSDVETDQQNKQLLESSI